MSSFEGEIQEPEAQNVLVDADSLTIDLVDGRTIIVPLVWYPRLWHGTVDERTNFEIIAGGSLIHWPELDEDLSVAGILAGRRSGESPISLNRWLNERSRQKRTRVRQPSLAVREEPDDYDADQGG